MNASNTYVSPDVQEVCRLHLDLFTDEFRQLSIREQLDRQAQRILEGHQTGNKAVVTHITCWHPELVGHSVDEIMSHSLTLGDARETIAREYGFADWSDVIEHGKEPPDPNFESAVDALLRGDLATLQELINRRPALIRESSQFGHRSTLLHYCGSNGVETYRQVVPRNLPDVVKLLLEAGADVNATARMYGGDCTTIALLISSSHPAEAGVMGDVVKILIEAGAETDGS